MLILTSSSAAMRTFGQAAGSAHVARSPRPSGSPPQPRKCHEFETDHGDVVVRQRRMPWPYKIDMSRAARTYSRAAAGRTGQCPPTGGLSPRWAVRLRGSAGTARSRCERCTARRRERGATTPDAGAGTRCGAAPVVATVFSGRPAPARDVRRPGASRRDRRRLADRSRHPNPVRQRDSHRCRADRHLVACRR